MNKATVIKALSSMEEEFSAEEFVERLLFIKEVEKGLSDVTEGRIIDLNDAKRRFLSIDINKII